MDSALVTVATATIGAIASIAVGYLTARSQSQKAQINRQDERIEFIIHEYEKLNLSRREENDELRKQISDLRAEYDRLESIAKKLEIENEKLTGIIREQTQRIEMLLARDEDSSQV